MSYRKVNIDRGPLLGPLLTTTGTTYLRTADISAVTQGQGVTMIHMTSGTIFTVKEGRMTIVVERLGLDLSNQVTINDIDIEEGILQPLDEENDESFVRGLE